MDAFVVGDIDSIWVKDFIIKVLIPLGYNVSIQYKEKEKSQFDSIFKENNIRYIASYKANSLVMRIPKIRVPYLRAKQVNALKKCNEKFPIVFVIYVTPFHEKKALTIKNENGFIYNLFIGSDILRISARDARKIKNILIKCKNHNICVSDRVADALIKKLNIDDCRIIHFGVTQFPLINKYYQKA